MKLYSQLAKKVQRTTGIAKSRATQYYKADGKIVNDITSFDFRNAKSLPSAIPETLWRIVYGRDC